jgi:hypothetical protein
VGLFPFFRKRECLLIPRWLLSGGFESQAVVRILVLVRILIVLILVLVLVLIVLIILVLIILIILGLPAKLHGTSAQGTAHLQCAPSSALSTTGSSASGLVIVE